MDQHSYPSSLTCILCSCHFKDPRLLPCRHTFCFACLKSLCDIATTTNPKKARITCPQCKVQFSIPHNGVEGFPTDEKMQALKDKIVQEIADNITRSMSNSKENVSSAKFSTSSTSGPGISRPSRLSTESEYNTGTNKTFGNKSSENSGNSGNSSFSFIYGDLGKYAKYFDSSDKSGNNDVSFKPTIRPDHTRLGYESSYRFRNRRMNSKERDNDEEKDLRRRTWYGSTLHSRRTQSLNRSSTYGDLDGTNADMKSSENLFKISEDREQVPSTEESFGANTSTPHSHKDSFFETPRKTQHDLNSSAPTYHNEPGNDSYHSNAFETPKSPIDRSGSDYTRKDSYGARRTNFAGPTRPTLSTHRENITSGSFTRKNSKDRKVPKSPCATPTSTTTNNRSPEPKISFRTRKQSPKGLSSSKQKKTKSPMSSPRRKFNDRSAGFDIFREGARKSSGDYEDRFKAETSPKKQDPISPSPHHHQFYHPTSPPSSSATREGMSHRIREHIDPDRRVKTARDRLSFNFDLRQTDGNVQQGRQEQKYEQEEQPAFQQHRQQAFERPSRLNQHYPQQHQQQPQQQKPQHPRLNQLNRKPRCNSVGPRFSLNKNDFKTDQDFKEHLLGMTMTKDQYDRIMNDFRNGRERLDSTGSHGSDDELSDEANKGDAGDNLNEEKTSDAKDDVIDDKGNDKATPIVEKDEQHEEEEVEPPPKQREPLIDENLLSSFRTKYSSALEVKRFPNQSTFPDLSEDVTKCWSCQKNDFGVPTAAAFLKSNSLVVADYGQSCLDFFDSGGHLEHSLTGIKPFGVASYNEGGNIIVGDRKTKSLRIFDEFGTDVSQIDNLGSLEWLSGLAVSRDGSLIMSDRSRCKIIISNMGGEMIKEFGSYGSGPKQLCMADFLTVDSKNRIIVCDSGNHCLKIFDSNGNAISTVGSRGNNDGMFEWPKGVAVDNSDNILVADTMNHRISLFSPDGVFIKHLLTLIPDPYNLTWFNNQFAVLHYNLKGMSQYDVYNYNYN